MRKESISRDTLRETLADEALLWVNDGLSWLFSTPLGQLVQASDVSEVFKMFLASDTLVAVFKELLRTEIEAEAKRWQTMEKPLRYRLSEGNIQEIRSALADPEWMRGEWLPRLVAHDVLEEVMGKTLYEVLKEFLVTVNPFFSSWGLPALLKKAGPLGRLGLFGVETGGRMFEGLKEEFERQMEPHLKAFLQKSAKASLLRYVALAQSEQSLKSFGQLRAHLFDDFLAKTQAQLVAQPDVNKLKVIEAILVALAEAFRTALLQENLEERISCLLERHGQKPADHWLKQLGIEPEAGRQILAKCLEPMARAMFTTEASLDRFERLFLKVQMQTQDQMPQETDAV